jgi:hypothetical protein
MRPTGSAPARFDMDLRDYKGVLSVDEQLDTLREWLEKKLTLEYLT